MIAKILISLAVVVPIISGCAGKRIETLVQPAPGQYGWEKFEFDKGTCRQEALKTQGQGTAAAGFAVSTVGIATLGVGGAALGSALPESGPVFNMPPPDRIPFASEFQSCLLKRGHILRFGALAVSQSDPNLNSAESLRACWAEPDAENRARPPQNPDGQFGGCMTKRGLTVSFWQ
jgi:hypothetical protein